jgi:uncharacterized protein (DUF885 family)
MKYVLSILLLLGLWSCNNSSVKGNAKEGNAALQTFFETYWQQRMQLYPLEATTSGDTAYNDRLTLLFTDSFRDTLRRFYTAHQQGLQQLKREELTESEQTSYDIFKREMDIQLEGLSFTDNYMPFNQMWAFPLDLGQLGAGTSSQPFKTEKDYRNWISRAGRFSAWADSAILYFRKGMASGMVLPKANVVKMIPQMQDLARRDTGNVFYGPLKGMPAHFTTAQQGALKTDLTAVIDLVVLPAYQRLAFCKRNICQKQEQQRALVPCPVVQNVTGTLLATGPPPPKRRKKFMPPDCRK